MATQIKGYEVSIVFKVVGDCKVFCDYEPSLKDDVLRFKTIDDEDLTMYNEIWTDTIHSITVKPLLTTPSL